MSGTSGGLRFPLEIIYEKDNYQHIDKVPIVEVASTETVADDSRQETRAESA